jgi:NAD(P)-dependent dehydrogenase (short-subunit alcohol dehydrogenase family)
LYSIIIFGGSGGIGRIIAEHFITEGHEISIADKNKKTLLKLKGNFSLKNLDINILSADITSERDVTRVFKSHYAKWQNIPDAVINCAAVQGPIGNSWIVPAKSWEETLKINLFGSYLVSRIAIREMLKKGQGSIITFSGGGAVSSRPNFSAYGVSKTGVLRLVETVADELTQAGYTDIIINAIAPGAVKTHMTGEIVKAGARAGQKAQDEAVEVSRTGGTPPEQILELINFLIDIKANHGLTGRLIHVREDYKGLIKRLGNNIPDEIGKMRRIPIPVEK